MDSAKNNEIELAPGSTMSGARVIGLAERTERARRAVRGFLDMGVGDGDSVALFLRNDIAVLDASLAAAALGALAVPINWHYTEDEAGYVLNDCAAKVLVVHADLWPRIAAVVAAETHVFMVATPPHMALAYGIDDAACVVPDGASDWESWLASHEPWQGDPAPRRTSMLYTSGTTGRPKGVRRQPLDDPARQAAVGRVFAEVMGIGPDMRALVTGPLYHSAPNAFTMRAAQEGASLILQARFDAEEMLALVARHRITHMHVVPIMFIRLLRLPVEVRGKYDLSSLVRVSHGAAPCPPEVKRAMVEWWGPVIREYYGATETGVITCSTSEESLARPGTVGRPVESASVRILDDDGRELGPGEVGEIYMRLGAIADFTYHGRDDERREIERDGHITCGDVGYVDEDGYLFLCDRKLDMVISGGVNIYPAEIEAVLIQMPGISDCAVFGIPDAEYGEALAAAIEPMAGTALTEDDVRAWLDGRQAKFKMPKVIEFHPALPREDSGKVFKRKLRDPWWESAGRAI